MITGYVMTSLVTQAGILCGRKFWCSATGIIQTLFQEFNKSHSSCVWFLTEASASFRMPRRMRLSGRRREADVCSVVAPSSACDDTDNVHGKINCDPLQQIIPILRGLKNKETHACVLYHSIAEPVKEKSPWWLK